MMKKFKLFLICIWASSTAGVFAQNAVLARFDKGFYVAGEVVWYQLLLPERLHGKDFSIKLSVFDKTGTSADALFLQTEGRKACSGYYALPQDIDPGFYRFSFTAMPENGRETELVQAAVPVYNDLKAQPSGIRPAESARPDAAPAISDRWNIEVVPEDGSLPRSGRDVRLTIKVTDRNGSPVQARGSVVVRDEALAGDRVYPGQTLFGGPALSGVPVFRNGIFQAGTIADAAGQPLQAPLLIALEVETGQACFTESDRAGCFLLAVPRFQGSRRFQILEPGGAVVRVTWDKRTLPVLEKELPYTAGILEYLELSRKRRKIYQLYGSVENALPATAPKAAPAEPEFDRSFRVQDYERFPDLITFFREVAWMVRFSPGKAGHTANMYDFVRKQYFESPPLFLVDGKATSDAGFVGQLKPAAIATIDLMYDAKRMRRYFPGIRAGGIVRIITLNGQSQLSPAAEAEITTLPGVQEPAGFPAAAPVNSVPRLGPLVCWQPDWATDAAGTGLLTFRQNDGPGEFCLEVLLQSDDGRRGTGRFCYSVK